MSVDIIIQIKECGQCPLFSRTFGYERNDGYLDSYPIDHCNGNEIESCEEWFGSKKCLLRNPSKRFNNSEIAKIIYVDKKSKTEE